MKTKDEMIKILVQDCLESIIQLGQNGDYPELEAWLGPIFKEDFDSCSDEEIESRYISTGLADIEEEEQ